jgi:hypothetical protein
MVRHSELTVTEDSFEPQNSADLSESRPASPGWRFVIEDGGGPEFLSVRNLAPARRLRQGNNRVIEQDGCDRSTEFTPNEAATGTHESTGKPPRRARRIKIFTEPS